jgi:predicted DNA-binding transcriptional regulator AlpA
MRDRLLAKYDGALCPTTGNRGNKMAIVTIAKAAELVGVSTTTINNRVRFGDLKKADYNAISTKELERFYGPLDKKHKRNINAASQANGKKGGGKKGGRRNSANYNSCRGYNSDVVTISEAAKLVGLSTKTIYYRIKTGDIKKTGKAGSSKISIKELERFYGPLKPETQQNDLAIVNKSLIQQIEYLKNKVIRLEQDKNQLQEKLMAIMPAKESILKKMFKSWRRT